MEATKARLIEHAATLFTKNGCKAITMDDIANSMGISKRTIYQIFSDKEQLLEACLQYFIELHELDIQQVLHSSDNVIVAFFKLLENTSKTFSRMKFNFLYEVQKYYPDTYKSTLKVSKQHYLDSTVKLLQKGQQDGIVGKDVHTAIISVLIYEVSIMTLHRDVFTDYGFDKKTAMNVCMNCIIRGLFTEKGLEVLDKNIEEYKKLMYDNTI